MNGEDGNDIFLGRAGDDTINGGAGLDAAGYDLAVAGVIVNLATGRASGGDGNDRLLSIEQVVGSKFNDTLIGSANDDLLAGALGDDRLDGGGGFDTAVYGYGNTAVNVNLTKGVASGGDGNDTLSNFEGIIGTSLNDTLIGSAVSNFIFGRAGNDFISGEAGNDQLFSEAGNDTLNGGDGSDTADYSALGQVITILPQGVIDKGSLGIDLISRVETIVGAIGQANAIDGSSATGGVSLTANLTANSLTVNNIPGIGSLSFTVRNFVNVTGTSNNDDITGNGDDNFLFGEAGDDLLGGFEGDDNIGGGAGDDNLDGGDGNDFLAGV